MKTLVQRVRQARAALKAGEASDTGVGVLAADLRALDARLHWHCHFIQKLEAEPAIEFRCFNRACEALRERGQGGELMAAWRAGMTGVPFVDACMRALQARGWINFRMRAMLVSFAAYDLWVDWRDFSHFLACQFIDYEPGIHYSQLQMQSGTTGINTLRMYNPWKQGVDQDPDGVFIGAWVPELADWTAAELHSPLAAGRRPAGYPAPVVDHAAAVKRVRAAFSALRRDPAHRVEAERVFREHGSRKRPRSRQGAARRDGGRAAARSASAARPAGSAAQQGLLGL
jgi:deoxyribodipyrimidine photo-lyase